MGRTNAEVVPLGGDEHAIGAAGRGVEQPLGRLWELHPPHRHRGGQGRGHRAGGQGQRCEGRRKGRLPCGQSCLVVKVLWHQVQKQVRRARVSGCGLLAWCSRLQQGRLRVMFRPECGLAVGLLLPWVSCV